MQLTRYAASSIGMRGLCDDMSPEAQEETRSNKSWTTRALKNCSRGRPLASQLQFGCSERPVASEPSTFGVSVSDYLLQLMPKSAASLQAVDRDLLHKVAAEDASVLCSFVTAWLPFAIAD